MYTTTWLFIIVATAIIEALTVGLVTIWFTIGALFAMIASIIGLSVIWQIFIFLVVSAIMLIFTRPLINNKLQIRKIRTNADKVIGEKALVIEDIDPILGKGQVKIAGQIWSAKSLDSQTILKNEYVKIKDIQGVHLVVEQKKEEE